MDCIVMMGMFPLHLHLLIARTMILRQWLQCIGFIDVSEQFAVALPSPMHSSFIQLIDAMNWMKVMLL